LINDRAIPGQAKLFQCAQDVITGSGNLAWRVKVFHAQQPLALVMPGIQKAPGCGNQRSEV
jgi:hypothetical protein